MPGWKDGVWVYNAALIIPKNNRSWACSTVRFFGMEAGQEPVLVY
jgi:hypothetical protein